MSLIVNIVKGGKPMKPATLGKQIPAYMASLGWDQRMRDQATYLGVLVAAGTIPGSATWDKANADMYQFNLDLAETQAVNTFNLQLEAYRKAAARLARYRLADGRAEVIEAQPTGETDEAGDPVMESVVVQAAIDPLEATVEQIIYDEEGNAATETVPNPAIVTDDAERAEAQAVVDATPQEVKDFDG